VGAFDAVVTATCKGTLELSRCNAKHASRVLPPLICVTRANECTLALMFEY